MAGNTEQIESEVEHLSKILNSCFKAADLSTAFQSIAELFTSGRLSRFLDSIFSTSADPVSVRRVLSDLIKMPDRAANLVAAHKLPHQATNLMAAHKLTLPPELEPALFCSSLLKQLALAMAAITELNSALPAFILSKLFLNYRQAMTVGINTFWRFAIAHCEENCSGGRVFQALCSSLDAPTLEKCFFSILSSTSSPQQIRQIFGNVFKEERKLKIIESNLFLRGKLLDEEVAKLMVYLSLVEEDILMKVLSRGFLLLADPTYVEHSDYRDELFLCKILCSCLSALTVPQLAQARLSFLPVLMKGSIHWLDSTQQKRNLGMSMILIILKKFGEDKVPEWEIQDQYLFNLLETLASSTNNFQESPVTPTNEILSTWNQDLEEAKPRSVPELNTVMKNTQPKHLPTIKAEQSNPLDSDDDDDDDDFPAYDMSNDTKKDENEKNIFYLRDAIDEIGNPESDHTEKCLALLPELCRRHLKHEDPALVSHILKVVLYSQNRFDSAEWIQLRESAMISVLETKPVEGSRCLVQEFFNKNYPMDTRFGILTWLVNAGKSISKIYSGKKEFAEYITTTVQGLCGGMGWSKLEFTGLDTHIVSQLLISTGELLRLGRNQVGWERLASSYLELVLFTASSGRAVIESTCVHSISLVLALTEPHMFESMAQVLGRLGLWLGGRQGELQEAGANAMMVLALLQQEAAKLQMEKELQGVQSISLRTPSLNKI